MSRKPNELTGQKFGCLIALERTERRVKDGGNYYWKCRCDCGNLTEVNTANLHSGQVQSCGCTNNRRKYE